ncbi:ArsR/SmtB family transcription factor [Swaminathania salitolerans]|uniref:HTH arsR-type domain-containing protein n=1 Tax=Swaminathania salitolerans TaxID=182838 RepID=A0A511BLF7_9PROT|nr:metalloregulator ArsR/SmtB family transcription factor [Swaminathania salitolerans]GBQ10129.1 ArsR family transcriptional regulator [Swaminathania salitolerans LMG 21291]GEL01177.1 hypothetical protein SSA02_03400 [Swaminathania salitolerans]
MTSPVARNQSPLLERLRLYGQPQRLAILTALIDRQRSVSDLEATTGIGQPALSQQLGELRRAGLIASRREAREVFYAYADPVERARAMAVLSLLDPPSTPSLPVPGLSAPPSQGAHFAAILPE